MEKDKEDQIVEKELEQVEKGSQTPKEAEKDIAEGITKQAFGKTLTKTEEIKEEKPEEKSEIIDKSQNKMRNIEIEKMVLNCGGTEEKLDKSVKLLEMITNRKIQRLRSTRRIPAFGISPKKESGCKVTIRKKEKIDNLLKRFFAALENKLSKKQITTNHASFGVHEYIEIPGLEYNRDIGILGFEVSLVFKRKGKRVKMKKIKRGKIPKKQDVTPEEIITYLKQNFQVEVG
jgi:large subunit ribosomal protein L5